MSAPVSTSWALQRNKGCNLGGMVVAVGFLAKLGWRIWDYREYRVNQVPACSISVFNPRD